MDFVLDLVKQNGTRQSVLFDNETNRFYDPVTGEQFSKEHQSSGWRKYSPYCSVDYNNVMMLYITMGLKCNFDCEYCHQKNIRDKSPVADFTPNKVQPFIENLRNLDINPGIIAIWGGEPLVYWKTLKLLIPALRNLYPDADINFPTNGSLLSQDVVNFLRKYKVGYFISYDGKVSARGKSILDDEKVVQALRTEPGIAIMPTWNKKSIPIHAIRKEFQGKGIRLDNISVYAVARCNSYNRGLAKEIEIPVDKREAIEKYLYATLSSERHAKKGLFQGFIGIYLDTLRKYKHGIGIDSIETTFCNNTWLRDVTIDADGKILNCMNAPMMSLGSFWNKAGNKPQNLSRIFQPPIFKDKCFTCPFIAACKGGCPLIHDENSPEFVCSCRNLQILARPLFKFSVEELFDAKLVNVLRHQDMTNVFTFNY